MQVFSTELLKEPLLEFGDELLCPDPKSGITRGGFFSVSNNSHRSEIHYAIVGTNNHIELTQGWIIQFEDHIVADIKYLEDKKKNRQAEIIDGEVVEHVKYVEEEDEEMSESQLNSLFGNLDDPSIEKIDEEKATFEVNKRMNPDFPGFTSSSVFQCKFSNDESNNKSIKEITINAILEADYSKLDKALKISDIYIDSYKRLIEESLSKPNVCLIIIPSEVFKKLSSIKYSNGKYFNLRRYLKSQLIAIPNAIPVQIILEDTLNGSKSSLQDMSMQAWNFITANYYKNGGIPWTLTLKDKTSCFIGISFHKVQDAEKNLMRSSIAQAFNYEGKGVIFIGKQFEWSSHAMNTP